MIGIWGSCVTRDTFELGGEFDGELTYHARSSWISQASPTGGAVPTTVPEGTGFAHRMVSEDRDHSILERTAGTAPDLVIFDLIDERFDVVKVGDAYYTVSDYYGRLELEEPLRDAATETVPFRDQAREPLFAAAAADLAPKWLAALPDTRFALHQAWYTARAADPAYRFYSSAPTHVAWSNRRLAAHYAALRTAFGQRLHIIEPNRRDHLIADAEHKWGLAHFHYVPSYYEQALAQIEGIASGPLEAGPAKPTRLTVPSPAESGAEGPTVGRLGRLQARLRQLPTKARATASAARPSP
jgi:hypothetical protein